MQFGHSDHVMFHLEEGDLRDSYMKDDLIEKPDGFYKFGSVSFGTH